MQAFHNDPKIQNLYLNRIRSHAKADEIKKGFYWEKGKGCAVGCTIHSSDHSSYETELGIPRWLAMLEDKIFEGMSNKRAKTFPVEFLEAINLGADLEKIKIPMLIFIVELARKKTKNERALKAIDGVLTELRKNTLDLLKLCEAGDVAYAYAAVAAVAAAVAAVAADADAADAVAADVAEAAAYAAAAAQTNEYTKLADKLLQLIRECK